MFLVVRLFCSLLLVASFPVLLLVFNALLFAVVVCLLACFFVVVFLPYFVSFCLILAYDMFAPSLSNVYILLLVVLL